MNNHNKLSWFNISFYVAEATIPVCSISSRKFNLNLNRKMYIPRNCFSRTECVILNNVVILKHGFEYNEEKQMVNICKYGIYFVRAAKIFVNPVLERIDDRKEYNEKRMIALGHWQEYFVVVVYT